MVQLELFSDEGKVCDDNDDDAEWGTKLDLIHSRSFELL